MLYCICIFYDLFRQNFDNLFSICSSLESLGAIQDKIHVQASDDAYTR
jgi:hypothetical protein